MLPSIATTARRDCALLVLASLSLRPWFACRAPRISPIALLAFAQRRAHRLYKPAKATAQWRADKACISRTWGCSVFRHHAAHPQVSPQPRVFSGLRLSCRDPRSLTCPQQAHPYAEHLPVFITVANYLLTLYIEQHLRAQLELLQDADGAAHNRDDSPASGNSYEDLQIASQNAIRAIASKASGESHIHPDLREPSPPHGQSTGMESSNHPPLAPAPPNMQALQSAAEQNKPKRELSQSKRAAQNRAAQVCPSDPSPRLPNTDVTVASIPTAKRRLH